MAVELLAKPSYSSFLTNAFAPMKDVLYVPGMYSLVVKGKDEYPWILTVLR